MLTGDTESSAMETAQELDMDYAYTDLLPGDKLEQLEDFLMVQDARERLVCVGDGINDAPVLARADVGIAMGALGSAAAIEAADIVVNHNITFALAIKFMILFFAVVGYFGMWEAIIAEVAVVFIAILNAAGVVRYVA